MILTGIQHVAMTVDDHDSALRFYIDGLGLQKLDRPDVGITGSWLLANNGVQVHLVEVPGHRGSDGNHVAFEVEDIDKAIAELRAKGVDVPDWFDIGTGRQTFIKDPSSNIIELNQPNA